MLLRIELCISNKKWVHFFYGIFFISHQNSNIIEQNHRRCNKRQRCPQIWWSNEQQRASSWTVVITNCQKIVKLRKHPNDFQINMAACPRNFLCTKLEETNVTHQPRFQMSGLSPAADRLSCILYVRLLTVVLHLSLLI